MKYLTNEFIHSFDKRLLDTYSVPGTVLDIRNPSVIMTDGMSCPYGAYILMER